MNSIARPCVKLWPYFQVRMHFFLQDLDYELTSHTLRPRQNGRHFADDNLKCVFLNEKVLIPIEISLKFVPKGPIDNIPALVYIMAWRRPGDKPLSEPMMVSLPTHIYVTRPQWVKKLCFDCSGHDLFCLAFSMNLRLGFKFTLEWDIFLPQKMTVSQEHPDSKIHRANMGPIWGRQDPGGPHVGPMNFAIWASIRK